MQTVLGIIGVGALLLWELCALVWAAVIWGIGGAVVVFLLGPVGTLGVTLLALLNGGWLMLALGIVGIIATGIALQPKEA